MTDDPLAHQHSFVLQQGSTCRCGATEDRVPTTVAGRSLQHEIDYLLEQGETTIAVGKVQPRILAIEAEASAQPAPPFDAERLRMRAERVIASFDWSDGSLPIITDDPIAFGNAVNRLRDALVRFGSAPSRSEPE